MFNNYGIPVSPFRSDNWSAAGYEKHVPVKLTLNSESGVYAKGEKVEVYASLTHAYTGALTMRVNLFGQRLTSSNDIKLSKETPTLIYSGTFDKASSIQVSVGNPKDRRSFKNIGFVVSPEEFTHGFDAPSDLMSFWDKQIAKMRESKMEITAVEVKHKDSEEYVCYDLEISMPEGNPVRGYMAMPRNASKASLPIVLLPHAAGVQKPHCKSSISTAVEWAKKGKGTIALDINAHGMLNGQPQDYYDSLNATTLHEYASRPLVSHDEFYFRLMYLRMVRALDYMATLGQWDGKRVLVRGESQGAGQAGALAALDPRVSMSVMIVPALTDLGGIINGGRGGWPSFYSKNVTDPRVSELSASILPYYDVALLLKHTKAQLVIECGLVDTTCPAECVYSAYNNATSSVNKVMLTYPYRPHHRVEETYYKDWQLKVDDVRNSLVEEHLR